MGVPPKPEFLLAWLHEPQSHNWSGVMTHLISTHEVDQMTGMAGAMAAFAAPVRPH